MQRSSKHASVPTSYKHISGVKLKMRMYLEMNLFHQAGRTELFSVT